MKISRLLSIAFCLGQFIIFGTAEAKISETDKEVTIYNANAPIVDVAIYVLDTVQWGIHEAKPSQYTKDLSERNRWTIRFKEGWPTNAAIIIETKQYQYTCQLPVTMRDDYGQESSFSLNDSYNDITIISKKDDLEVYLSADYSQIKLPTTRSTLTNDSDEE